MKYNWFLWLKIFTPPFLPTSYLKNLKHSYQNRTLLYLTAFLMKYLSIFTLIFRWSIFYWWIQGWKTIVKKLLVSNIAIKIKHHYILSEFTLPFHRNIFYQLIHGRKTAIKKLLIGNFWFVETSVVTKKTRWF